jgi:hypothetical protein
MAWLRLPRRSLRPVGRSVPTPTLTTCHPVLLDVSSRTFCRTCRQDTSHRPQNTGRGVKSLGRLGRVTASGLTHRFFWSARGLNYFSEIKEIKRPSANRSRTSREFSRGWTRCLGLSPRQIAPGRAFIFRARCVGGGGQKSGTFKPGPRRASALNYAELAKLFFASAPGGITISTALGSGNRIGRFLAKSRNSV